MPGEGPHAPLRDGQRPGSGHPAAPEQRSRSSPVRRARRIGFRNWFGGTSWPSPPPVAGAARALSPAAVRPRWASWQRSGTTRVVGQKCGEGPSSGAEGRIGDGGDHPQSLFCGDESGRECGGGAGWNQPDRRPDGQVASRKGGHRSAGLGMVLPAVTAYTWICSLSAGTPTT